MNKSKQTMPRKQNQTSTLKHEMGRPMKKNAKHKAMNYVVTIKWRFYSVGEWRRIWKVVVCCLRVLSSIVEVATELKGGGAG